MFAQDQDSWKNAVHTPANIYLFVKGRMRQICADLRFYMLKVQTQEMIDCMETMIRYIIVAGHDGIRQQDFSYRNFKQLTGFLGDLDEIYKSIKLGGRSHLIKTNNHEMLCYQVITTANSATELQGLLRRITDQDEELTPLLNEAITIAKVIQLGDFARFFKMF